MSIRDSVAGGGTERYSSTREFSPSSSCAEQHQRMRIER